MAKEKKDAEATEVVVAEEEKKKESIADEKKLVDDFIERKLTAINQMENEAKARVLAARVLSNRKG